MKADIFVVVGPPTKKEMVSRFNGNIVKFWSSTQAFLADGREVVYNQHKERWEYHPE